jgi:imidazolonepropionase-like amidohydrolase
MFFLACASSTLLLDTPSSAADSFTTPTSSSYLLLNATIVGQGQADIRVENGIITAIGSLTPEANETQVDLKNRFLAPAFIDSHVHLAYRPEAATMAANGIALAVDLAAPIEFLSEDHTPLRILTSGPMITATSGYPTQGWGRDGYGLECADAAAAEAGVLKLLGLGAGLIKLPVTGEPVLPKDALKAAVQTAHTAGVKVVSHALGTEDAALAAEVGVDALAHTPVETLTASVLQSWSSRAVISTLWAFGGSTVAVNNLKALKSSGTTILYGTDFGNTSTAGIDPYELRLLQAAGLSNAEIIAAGTSTPAAWWGVSDLGSLSVGKSANILILSEDPLQNIETLSKPIGVLSP